MADLALNEKYPGSWRLDHPDFPDVRKTPYQKAVITDIKVHDILTPWSFPAPSPPYNYYGDGGDRPTTVVIAKAKVDDGEDYLPLFFHTKAQYWDEEDQYGTVVKPATTFNQEERYFDKAWQSFRVGDEVAVMLREGKPVRIMGFADGKPRIGEDWVKVVGPLFDAGLAQFIGTHFWNWQCSNAKIGFLDVATKDPLGLDLGLTEAYAPSKIQRTWQGQPTHPGYYDFFGVWHDDVDFITGNPVPNPWTQNGNGWEYSWLADAGFVNSPPAPYADFWYQLNHSYQESADIIVEFMFPVGAILYIWQFNYSISMNKGSFAWVTPADAAALIPSALQHVSGGEYFNGDAYYMTPGAVGPETPINDLSPSGPQIGAGVYSEKLKAAVLGSGILNPVNKYQGIYSQLTPHNMIAQPLQEGFYMDWQNVLIYVKPHNPA